MPSAGQFVTLISGAFGRHQAARLVARLREPRFWTAYPVTTSPTDDPTFAPDVYWRGNVWPSVNWLIYEGLHRAGEQGLARSLAESAAALLAKSGLREYYNPLTGAGIGGTRFGWTAAFVDMIKREGLA
jgi:glycogen debranching enzyme